MLNRLNPCVVAAVLGIGSLTVSAAKAQTITPTPSIALKNGETFELPDAYYISTACRSLLIATPEVEILEGPPGVSVAIKEAMVTPRASNCAKPVTGGKVIISAKDVDGPSFSTMTLRYKFKTRDGDRFLSQVYKIALFP
jgi:hypothetical protein